MRTPRVCSRSRPYDIAHVLRRDFEIGITPLIARTHYLDPVLTHSCLLSYDRVQALGLHTLLYPVLICSNTLTDFDKHTLRVDVSNLTISATDRYHPWRLREVCSAPTSIELLVTTVRNASELRTHLSPTSRG